MQRVVENKRKLDEQAIRRHTEEVLGESWSASEKKPVRYSFGIAIVDVDDTHQENQAYDSKPESIHRTAPKNE